MANGGNTRRPVKNADKKAKKKSENRQNSHKRMFRWFLFGVFFSCTPLIVSISINWYLGYETITSESGQIKYLADFILVVFAVATNACGYATDGKIRVFLMVISIGSTMGISPMPRSYLLSWATLKKVRIMSRNV